MSASAEGTTTIPGNTPATAETQASRRYSRYVLFILFLICFFNYADRFVIVAVAAPIRAELGLNDFQLGLLQGLSFALLYSVLGIPFARLAEHYSRVKILSVATAAWSVMTVVCGFATNFVQMLMARVGVGVGEAGFMGPASSLIGDYFPPRKRAMAVSIMMLGVPFGGAVGAIAGGWIGQELGWRWAFFIIGSPGVLVGLLIWMTLREPLRGLFEKTKEQSVQSLRQLAAALARNRAFCHAMAGGTLAGIGLHGIGGFLPIYFMRAYDLSLAQAGVTHGLVTLVSVGGGLLLGGGLADRGGRKDLRWYAWIPAIGTILAAPLYYFAFTAPEFSFAVPLFVVAGTCLLLHYGPGMAFVQNLATARTRASTIAIYQLVVNGISLGLGPVLIGAFSDWFTGTQLEGGAQQCMDAAAAATTVCREAMAAGLRQAFLIAALFYIWGGIHYLLAGRNMAREAAEPAGDHA